MAIANVKVKTILPGRVRNIQHYRLGIKGILLPRLFRGQKHDPRLADDGLEICLPKNREIV